MATKATASVRNLSFKVDAALLEELGQRLIGRPSIALAELVKNAYDADARVCEIRFEENAIEIVDDGHGMKPKEFEDRWMRIASTHKLREKTSRHLKRPLTGSKGIGRLCAQFLARKMRLISRGKSVSQVIEATINWDRVISGKDLKTVKVRYETRPSNDEKFSNGRTYGVSIRLEGLRDEWSLNELKGLARQLWMLQSPFKHLRKGGDGDSFVVRLSSHEFLDQLVFNVATNEALDRNWRARILGRIHRIGANGKAKCRIEFRASHGAPQSENCEFELPFPLYPREKKEVLSSDEPRDDLPYLDDAQFEIRVYRRSGRQAARVKLDELKDYLDEFGGVSIFDAGFRIPYYDRHDWLDIERDYSRRITVSQLLPSDIRQATRAMLSLPPRQNLLGVVLVNTGNERTTAKSLNLDIRKALSISSARDRLTFNTAYYQLKYLVRATLDIYANMYSRRVLGSEIDSVGFETRAQRESSLRKVLGEVRGEIDDETAERIDKAVKAYTRAADDEAKGLRRSLGVFGAIATAGMNAVAFSHELSREMRTLDSIVTDLRALGKKKRSKDIVASADRLAESTKSIGALRGLFSLVVDASNREQVREFGARVVLEEAIASMRRLLPGIEINVDGVPTNLMLPPGTMAEWSALFQNVLSNAWNAMLESEGKTILCRAESDGKDRYLWINDQGKGLGVDFDEATNLFEPFRRKLEVAKSQKPRMIGGQGVGLAIVRMIAEARGTEVGFVEPDAGFETCFELAWREK